MTPARDISGRKLAEGERGAEEQRAMLEFAMDQVHEAAFLIDLDDGIRFGYVNAEACRSLGYSREELLRMSVPDIDPDYTLESLHQEFRGRPAPLTHEARHKSKDGRIFPVEVRSNFFEYDGKRYSVSLVSDISGRKQAEQERRQAEEQRAILEFAMDRVHEGAFLLSDEGHILYVNGEAARSLGYSREELLGMSVRDIDPNFARLPREEYLHAFLSKRSNTFETRHKAKDGRVFPVEITTGDFTYGGAIYRMALVRDISERKQAEEERRQAEEQRAILEFAMDRVQEGAFLIDNDARFLYVNAEASRSLGYSREELLRMVVPDIDPDYLRERWDPDFRGNLRSMTLETRHKSKDGRVFPVEVKSSFFQYEGNGYSLSLVRDISARKQAEEERRQAEEQRAILEFAMERVQEGAFLLSDDGRFLYVNGAASRSLGYSREELLRMGVPDINPDYPQERWDRTFRGNLQSQTFEVRHKSKDGHIFPVEITANFFQYEGNNYNLSLVTDISERKRQEAQREAHLRFFECMDQVNRAIQGAADLEQMMGSVLDAVLSAFDCDRAWLLYPLDPEAPSWGVHMERSRPEYAHTEPTRSDIPMTPQTAAKFRKAREASGPVKLGPAYDDQLHGHAERFQIKSQMSMAIYPKSGKPWLFGMHQCSRERIWTPEEEQLFQEIGRRVCDSLTSLLTHRDLRQNEQKYREIFDNVSDSLILYEVAADGRFLLAGMNPCAERIMGISKAEAAGKPIEDIVPEKIAAHSLPLLRKCLETGEALTYEEDLELALGVRSLHTTLLPVRNDSGSIYRLIVFNRDITECKAAEKHLHMLMREVDHRAKNLLAVVQAVARLTAGQKDPKLFEERLNERIAALAANHDLLVKNEWRGVDMRVLATAQLAHFRDLLGSQVILDGPKALLKPAASQALGMALHELATNAGKYGALSRADGSVRVEWEIAADSEGTFFKIRWSEHGGPPPEQPGHRGFGHKVLVQMAEDALDAQVSLAYPGSGLVWELTAPAERAIEQA